MDHAEKRLGITFHPDYREFLRGGSDVAGAAFEPAVILPGSGHLDLYEVATTAWGTLGVPRDWLPFVEDNGDCYCLTPTGAVVFWSHEGPSDERWSSLEEWRQRVCVEEG